MPNPVKKPRLRVQNKWHTVWASLSFGEPLVMDNKTKMVRVDKRIRKSKTSGILYLGIKKFVAGPSEELYSDKVHKKRANKKFVSKKMTVLLLKQRIKRRNGFLKRLNQGGISDIERAELLGGINNIEELLEFPLHLRHLPKNTENLPPYLRKRYGLIRKAKFGFN